MKVLLAQEAHEVFKHLLPEEIQADSTSVTIGYDGAEGLVKINTEYYLTPDQFRRMIDAVKNKNT